MLPNKSTGPALILDLLKRHVWLIVIPPAVTFFAALLFSSTMPNTYQSEMIVAIIPQRVPDSFVRTTVTMRTDQRMDELSVQVMSRTNLTQVINELGLYREELTRLPIEDVVGLMRAAMDIGLEPLRRGPAGPQPPHAFHVRFTYSDPATAALVTQRIGAMFVEENSRGRGALAEATNAFLESELKQARRRLEEQEGRLEAFRQKHGKALPSQLQANMEAVRGLQLQIQALVESVARDRDRKLMLERLYREAASDAPIVAANPPAVGSEPAAPMSLERQLITARSSLATLQTKYTVDHPDVVRTRGQIFELENRIAADAKAPKAAQTVRSEPMDPVEMQRRENLRQMFAEIESLDRQTAFKEGEEKRLRGDIAEYQGRIESVPGLESEWVSLSRDYDTHQAAYKDLLVKAESAKVAVNLEEREIGEQFRIVDPAQVPVHPITSMRGFINGGALVAGLLVGFGIALLIEVRDTSFRSESDVLEVLTLPVLASVPTIIDPVRSAKERKQRAALQALGVTCLAGAGYLTWTLQLWKSLI